MPHGGLAAAHAVARRTGLVARLDARLSLLKQHRPYHESDHVLNIAYNALCGGRTLEDLELRRNDEAFLDALDVEAIPDPTTAGDFCRRFTDEDIGQLMEAINEARVEVWQRQEPSFFQRAVIDVDGTLVPTTGECKEGTGYCRYKRLWGYHPLLVSLANTQEPLFVVNRPGNVNSHKGAAAYLDQAIALCQRAGFLEVLMRGDTDFSQSTHLDRWDAQGVKFAFGYDAKPVFQAKADALGEDRYTELERRAKRAFVELDQRRARPRRFREEVVKAKGYKNIRLRSEDIAEFEHKPRACKKAYRMVVLRKNLSIEQGDNALVEDIRYFFYITNDASMTAAEVVFTNNDRCNQENLIEQLKNGVRALHAPVNSLYANWAYMVMTSLAWTLKAWLALLLPTSPRWRALHQADRRRWLKMDFRTFRKRVIDVPVQILTSGRQRIWRLLAWRPELRALIRLATAPG